MSGKQTPGHKERPWLDASDLKARTDIRRVLEDYGLKTSMTSLGSALVGPSLFHEGDAPSFRVDPGRGIWNDFQGRPEVEGRTVPGNVIGLVQALEDCSFRQALQIVAQRFATPAQGPCSAPEADEPKTQTPASPDPQDMPPPESDPQSRAPLFGKELRGLRYDLPFLAERGISEKTARIYGVGYSSRGLMKSRLVAPVRTTEGEIAGYVGRALKPVPRTELWKNPAGFHRSHYLFGLHRILDTGSGRKATKDYGLIVAQSPLDVLRLVEAGFTNAVALMAATASRGQLELLVDPAFNPTRRVTLLLDNNEAGQAGKRAAASGLIHSAFVRYACWKALDTEHTSPDRLDDEQLRQVLSLRKEVD